VACSIHCPGLSILLVTGSPVIHSLQLADDVVQSGKLDYIKLPCLTRTARGEYRAKYLESTTAEIIDAVGAILATVRHFAPDLVMVDKKPLGVKG
jgi:predicted glycosyltransferase